MNRAQLNKSTNIPFEIELNDNVADERFIADGMTEFERNEPTLKSKACLKCLYFTKIISALCCYLEYFSYLYTIN